MASSRSITASLQRSLVRQNPVKLSRQCSPLAQLVARSTLSLPRLSVPRAAGQPRVFSISIPRRFADVKDDFDPKSVERESDEVHVCIVGGGKLVVVGHKF